jgi:hypothetical protein
MADAPLVAGDSVLVAQIEVRRTAARCGVATAPGHDVSSHYPNCIIELIACFLE